MSAQSPKMHTPNLVNNNIDRSQERYRLDWVGKREAIVNANSPINKTLRPCRG